MKGNCAAAPISAGKLVGPAIVLALAVVTVYLPIFSAGFVWDDDFNVTGNPLLRDGAGLAPIWSERPENHQYYPLTHTTFWIERRLWGNWAPGFHATNLALHAASAVLVWTLLRRLLIPGAWLAAAMFAVHPLNVESVAWITERKNVLSCFLGLITVVVYLRFAGLPATARRRRALTYVGALIAFAAALTAKTAIAPLPAVMLVLETWRVERGRWRDLLPLAPFFLLAIGFGIVTLWIEVGHLGAGIDWDLSFAGRWIVAGRAAWFYGVKLVWPSGLAFFYPRWEIDPGVLMQYISPLTALAVPGLCWLARRRIGAGPLVAVASYALLLAPALGFVDVYFFTHAYVQDHFQYYASIPLLALVAATLTRALDRGPAGPATRRVPSIVKAVPSLLMLVALGSVAWHRVQAFESWETLFRDSLATNPRSWGAQHNLGNWLYVEGRGAEGLAHLQEAVRLYEELIPAVPASPDLARAQNLRLVGLRYSTSGALLQVGRLAEAAAECKAMLAVAPDSARVFHRLAEIYLRQKRYDDAVRQLEQAVGLEPDSAELRADLARARFVVGRVEEALQDLDESLRLRPGYFLAQHRRGLVLVSSGRPSEAVQAFEAAIADNPLFIEAYRGLAQAARATGDEARASEAMRRYDELGRSSATAPRPSAASVR